LFFKKFKELKKLKEKVKQKAEQINKYNATRPWKPDVLHGENPWFPYQDTDGTFEITFYDFEESVWCALDYHTEKVIGVTRDEFRRIILEKFCNYVDSIGNGIFYKDLKSANKIIDEFKEYYDNYYMPRAVAKRLMNYSPGGYKPYFQWYADEHHITAKSFEDETGD
jgi:hypothetical protein